MTPNTPNYDSAHRQCIMFNILIRIAQECADCKNMYGSDALEHFIQQYIKEQNWHTYFANEMTGG
jgi:hypothetical protein